MADFFSRLANTVKGSAVFVRPRLDPRFGPEQGGRDFGAGEGEIQITQISENGPSQERLRASNQVTQIPETSPPPRFLFSQSLVPAELESKEYGIAEILNPAEDRARKGSSGETAVPSTPTVSQSEGMDISPRSPSPNIEGTSGKGFGEKENQDLAAIEGTEEGHPRISQTTAVPKPRTSESITPRVQTLRNTERADVAPPELLPVKSPEWDTKPGNQELREQNSANPSEDQPQSTHIGPGTPAPSKVNGSEMAPHQRSSEGQTPHSISPRASRPSPETPAAPTIRVTIGRIEVHAAKTEQPPPVRTPRKRRSPPVSLDDYLKRRNEA